MKYINVYIVILFCQSCMEPSHGRRDEVPPPTAALTKDEGGSTPNRTRGYDVINTLVRERVLIAAEDFNLVDLVNPPVEGADGPNEESTSIMKLLGAYDGNGTRFDYQGRHANSINMVLWYTIFSKLSQKVVATCGDGDEAGLNLNADVGNAVCLLAEHEAPDQSEFDDVWQQVMRSDAPESERDSWSAYLVEQNSGGFKGPELAKAALVTMLMNPYFLIQH